VNNFAVAVDGPAGTGKSTVVKLVAKKFGLKYIDTGAMYRTVALKVIKDGLNTKVKQDVLSILDNLKMEITFDEKGQVIYLDGESVNDKIRTPEVSIGSSNVAAIPEVRIKLVEIQRNLAKKFNVVMDGRDIDIFFRVVSLSPRYF
jgi:cytidylate kinase